MEQPAKQFPKRSAILTCLRQTTEHPSAEWIFQQLKPEYPDLSLGTVYRNLSLFKQQGLASSLGTVGGVERFDGDTTPHVHFICTRCGRIQDLPGLTPPEMLYQAAEDAAGGEVESCRLTFAGVCRDCSHSSVGGEEP